MIVVVLNLTLMLVLAFVGSLYWVIDFAGRHAPDNEGKQLSPSPFMALLWSLIMAILGAIAWTAQIKVAP